MQQWTNEVQNLQWLLLSTGSLFSDIQVEQLRRCETLMEVSINY
ncbi:hypothetical protein V6Z11_A12G004100 [Gossypium hirsutum]